MVIDLNSIGERPSYDPNAVYNIYLLILYTSKYDLFFYSTGYTVD